jgi:GxxExxY protein
MKTEQRDPLTHAIIGAAIDVHSALGAGVLESAFEECLCFELVNRGLSFQRQVALPLIYKGVRLEHGFRPDLIVERKVIVELKSVERLLPVHESQILTYMRLAGVKLGLLMNINSRTLVAGIKRMIL